MKKMKKIYNEKKIIFNESISGDIKNFENYEYVIGYSNATGIFKFSDGDFVYEILSINIYDDKKMGSYYLELIIYDNLDRETLQKIRSSYS